MKIRSFFLLLISPFGLFAQTINYTVKGQLIDTVDARYAYLMTLSYQIALSNDKVFQMAPVIDGKFEIKGSFDLEGKTYQQATVFFSRRANISKEEIQSKYRNFVWPSPYDRDTKTIALESMTLEVPSASKARFAKVVMGGTQTTVYDLLNDSSKNGYVDLPDLIRDNPDSQFSFVAVSDRSERFSYKDTIKTFWGTPLTLFPLLSDRLKNSPAGKALKAKIDNDSKL